ncbi:ABC transporter substrate-binding protein [Paenibacillus spongiae]|uniref:Extracellular solute-binding protein n=1 Tax=Paenibacillus spongiae TaxID=2909671 RepID=A0ABY5SIH7_9BACL|nr:extracellular solute-binding protein [Paenibacillus spongiae]UVI33846.1 extracellular solute-binding protein [Paenibacillus spongiae]
MRAITLVIICTMLISLLAACGSNNSKNGGETGNTPSDSGNKANTPANTSANTPEEPAKIDLGGRTIQIAQNWDGTPKGDTAASKAQLDKIAELEKTYNVKIKYISLPYEELQEKFVTTTLAGEPFADIIRIEYTHALAAALNGQLSKLSEFTSSDSDINNENKLLRKAPKIAGEEYGFDGLGTNGVMMHYNRDIFKQLGLPDPHELYNNGEWTWDKFLELAKMATKDTNNDGKIDVWGFSGWAAKAGRDFAASNGAAVTDDVNGKEGLTNPAMIEALEFVNKLYNEENVVKIKTGKKSNWEEMDTFKGGDVAMFITADWQMWELPFEFGLVPIPMGPKGSKEYTYSLEGHGLFIPKGVKNADVVFSIYEQMQDIPQTEEYPSQNYLEERYKYEEDIQMLREHIAGTGLLSLDGAYQGYPYNDVVNEIIDNNASVTATVEKYKQQAQAAIDSLGKK